MSSISINNTKNKSIYNYIKTVNEDLYYIIKKAGAKDIFMKSHLTFLMPNITLLKKIQNVEPKQAMNMLRELLLRNTVKHLYDFTGKIENLNGNFLKNPSGLNLQIDSNFERLIGYNLCAVYLYDNNDLPESILLDNSTSNNKQNNIIDYKIKKHNQVIKKYKKYIKNKQTDINPFVIEIANILRRIKNTELYLVVCELMDNNAMITWFIIMQLGLHENPILPNDLFKLRTINHPSPQKEYNEAFEHVNSNYNGKSWFRLVGSIREKLLNRYSDRVSLPEHIIKSYQKNYMKLLQDEIRYRYCGLNEQYWFECIHELENIDWNNPKEYVLLANEELYNQLIDPSEEFYSGPVGFVKSIYFMYKPLTEKNLNIIIKNSGGSCMNPKEDGLIFGGIGDRLVTNNNLIHNEYDVQSILNGLSSLDISKLCELLLNTKKININSVWNKLNDIEKKQFKNDLLLNTKNE